ncbi:hypothetical protein BH09BAC3_BH09BAC3_13020 [soil metagenome]
MRVLLICGAGIVSGKEIMSLHLLRELKARGHECFVITSEWGCNDFRIRLGNLEIPFFKLRIGFISKTLTWSAIRMTLIQGFYFPLLLYKYSRLKKKIKPDVVIHTNFHHAFLLNPVAVNERNIYWSHEIIANSSFYHRLFHLIGRKTQLFVPVSNATADSLINVGISRDKVKVIKNGASLASTTFDGHNLSPKRVLAIIGQVSQHKGVEVLLKALSDIPKELFHLKIIGLGNEGYLQGVKASIDMLGISQNCQWVGFVTNTDEIYRGVDIVIVPSIFPDPYPTTVMEAGLRHIPVIASNIGGLPEMVNDGVNGYLCEANDVISLRNSIMKILTHTNFESLRSETFRFAVNNFSIRRFGDNFDELIKEGAN